MMESWSSVRADLQWCNATILSWLIWKTSKMLKGPPKTHASGWWQAAKWERSSPLFWSSMRGILHAYHGDCIQNYLLFFFKRLVTISVFIRLSGQPIENYPTEKQFCNTKNNWRSEKAEKILFRAFFPLITLK